VVGAEASCRFAQVSRHRCITTRMFRAAWLAGAVVLVGCGNTSRGLGADAGASDRPTVPDVLTAGDLPRDVSFPVPEFDDLIDDLDDGDNAIRQRGFRVGYWYTFNDRSPGGVQSPASDRFVPSPGGAGDSAHCARTTGGGFSRWGAGMGLDLNNALSDPHDPVPTNRGSFDASLFTGVVFSAKGNTPLQFAIATEAVVPVEWKGTCIETTANEPVCDRPHEVTIALTPDWQTFAVPFAALIQPGPGPILPFEPSRSMAILFYAQPSPSFDIAVDDISFYK
jgi:predicted small secreted protein